jgi:uncharacterized membrane protein YbhN (UPF0104 family)
VHEVWHAIVVFAHHLAAVRWHWLGIAVGCQLLKLLAVSRAWRNAVAAAYPGTRVPWPKLFGAYVAGTGVNSILPARSGEAVKLYIAKHRVDGATYPTLGATVVLLTLFDSVVAACFIAWAIAIGALPAVRLLSHLPSFDFHWFFAHPRASAAIGGVLLVGLLVLFLWGARRVEEFWRHVRQGFAALHDPPRYLRRVAFWQLVDWSLRLTTVFFMLRAFEVPATVHNALLVQVSQSLATVLPISPGGIGTEQTFLVYLFRGQLGKTLLLSFSVGMRIALTVVNVVLGFAAILIMLRTFRFRRAIEDSGELVGPTAKAETGAAGDPRRSGRPR